MGWIFSAALVALCLLGAPPAAGGAPENSGKRGVPESSGKGGVPESSVKDIPEGVFPGEVRRLPGPRERDALSLLLGAADLFLALEFPPPAAGGVPAGGGGDQMVRGVEESGGFRPPQGRESPPLLPRK